VAQSNVVLALVAQEPNKFKENYQNPHVLCGFFFIYYMACSAQAMGFYQTVFGSKSNPLNFTLKRKFQWQFMINNITSSATDDSDPLPCIRASRPKLNFREMQAEHLNETIYYPSKPDWQTIQITLYDRCINANHPVWAWVTQQYDPSSTGCSAWYPCIDNLSYKPCADLQLYDGCGNIVEQWAIEHCYPLTVDFGELDMNSSDVVTAEVTLRYDRAWQTYPAVTHTLYESSDTVCSSCDDAMCSSTVGGLDSNSSSSNLMASVVMEIEPDFVMF
jgi:hypothetical protein